MITLQPGQEIELYPMKIRKGRLVHKGSKLSSFLFCENTIFKIIKNDK